jgi:hypothetical protein
MMSVAHLVDDLFVVWQQSYNAFFNSPNIFMKNHKKIHNHINYIIFTKVGGDNSASSPPPVLHTRRRLCRLGSATSVELSEALTQIL